MFWYVCLCLIACHLKKEHILELRKMPADAISDKMDFKFVYEKKGEKKEFGQNELPDSTGHFHRKDIIFKKERIIVPPINDFVLNTISGTDTTEPSLNTRMNIICISSGI